jgi:hypothetical protein
MCGISGCCQIAGIDLDRLSDQYDELARLDPTMLWRFMRGCFWWQRCVRGPTG